MIAPTSLLNRVRITVKMVLEHYRMEQVTAAAAIAFFIDKHAHAIYLFDDFFYFPIMTEVTFPQCLKLSIFWF